MFCKACNMEVASTYKFCPKCGGKDYVLAYSQRAATDSVSPVAVSNHQPRLETPAGVSGVVAGFRDLASLTQWLLYLLFAAIAVDVIGIFSAYLQYQFLSQVDVGAFVAPEVLRSMAETNDSRQQLVGILQLCVGVTTIATFALWIYRANANVRQLGARGMKFTPGWSVGWYFIPFFNLVRPYQAMKEIWCASKTPDDWNSVARGSILPWWWGLFLAHSIIGGQAFKFYLRSDGLSDLMVATGMDIASSMISLPATVVAIMLVKQIHAMQMAHSVRFRS